MDEVDECKVSINAVCEILGTNRKTYYNQLNKPDNAYKLRRDRLASEINQIHKDSKEIYGAPKITRILRRRGEVVSERLVGKIMREHGLRAHYTKPWTRTTRNSNFGEELKNIIKRDFNPVSPNRIWCSDITYVWTKEDGFAYLTTIMDLFSRKIIGWKISRTMEADDVLKCLKIARNIRYWDKALVVHSDRGSQYISETYKKLTKGMSTSYSDKGNPWDNAPIEAFHALIKREWFSKYQPVDYEDAYRLTFEYIEGFYNTTRLHSFCDYLSPNEYEQQFMKTFSA